MSLQRSKWLSVIMMAIFSMFFTHCSKSDDGGGGGGGGGSSAPVDECASLTQDDEAATDEAAEGDELAEEEMASVDCEEASGNTPGQQPGDTFDPDDTTTTDDPPSTIPQDVLAGLKEGHGCLQGVVTNGFTGQPIDLSDKLTDPAGLYVLIRNNKLKAQIIPDDAYLVGQYFICGIPLEETYPVFAFLDGFLSFESTVNIASTRAGTKADGDVKAEFQKADPITRANIALFPADSGGRPLVVRVYHEGKPVDGAWVDVEPLAGQDHFAFEGTFASSADTRLFPMRASTGADGLATFAPESVALGHRYRISVTAPEGMDLADVAAKELTFGVSGATLNIDQNNYVVNFDLGDAQQPLAIISCSPQGESYNASGTVQIVFNRPIAIISPDEWRATLAGATTGTLPNEIDNDNIAQTVSASITGGNTLVLSPKFATALQVPDYNLDPTNVANGDKDAAITYLVPNMNLTVVGDNTVNQMAIGSVAGIDKCSPDRGAVVPPATVGPVTGITQRFFREFP